MGKIGLVLAASAALVLSACAADPFAGALTGDGAAVLYAQMSDQDVELAVAAMQESLTNDLPGEVTSWENPATGNSGTITQGGVFVTDQGVFCRDYEERLFVGGVVGITANTACRGADGTWQLVG